MKSTKYIFRYLAKVTLEAVTPIAVGSGEKNILTDAVVATDVNGLPFLPGSTIAGLLRHALADEEKADRLFGFQKAKKGHGSLLSVTDAVMVGSKGVALDGLLDKADDDYFCSSNRQLPIRQHVRINSDGVAEDNGKFDGQVSFKGSRFVFEIELSCEEDEQDDFFYLLDKLQTLEFRVGSGTRSGYGHVRVVAMQTAIIDLRNENDRLQYLRKSSCLSEPWKGYSQREIPNQPLDDNWEHFSLSLSAKDFFLFGSGLSDDVADMTPVKEKYIAWDADSHPRFMEGTLIPGSSVKGALLHRTAYHWNRLNQKFADKGTGLKADVNPAVIAIFGTAANDEKTIVRGKLIIDDVIIPERRTKILNHVSIDRFTGGALDGALFTERVTDGKDLTFNLEIFVQKDAFDTDKTIRQAFVAAIDDLKNGLLPLGGGTNRGNGIFYEDRKR